MSRGLGDVYKRQDPDSLDRLVRYLAGLGIVERSHASVRLTELGELLRTDASPSLHALAVLYGGPFYESFGGLAHSVRTGGAAFDHVLGKHHFEYFAERPQLASLFDRAMASSASIFGRIADIVDLSAASVVVDVAGGNGELLAQILPAAPTAASWSRGTSPRPCPPMATSTSCPGCCMTGTISSAG